MASDRRMQVLQSHLQATEHSNMSASIELQDAAASIADSTQQYCEILPERLSDPGPWTVRRQEWQQLAALLLPLCVHSCVHAAPCMQEYRLPEAFDNDLPCTR